MKYLKLYENHNNDKFSREIDINNLYSELLLKHKQLGVKLSDIPKTLRQLINDIFVGKYVEIQKTTNPIDGEVSYNEKGTLEWIKALNSDEYIVKLQHDENKYWLSNKSHGFYPIIKVYNSEEIDLEYELNLLIATNKYNL
jgi:hypothetical protein